ncbi:MAG: hypothetical protein LCI00_24395 [Chloroflexi bacterium]|nr:hypothetical protein [Chloroflexota bacterium]
MERYKSVPLSETLICNSIAGAIGGKKQVAPPNLHSSSHSESLQLTSHIHDIQQTSTFNLYAKIAAPYNACLASLSRILAQVKPSLSNEHYCRDETDTQYQTALGILSFAQIYEHTHKYAAFVLHHTYQVHPNDVDDGLQAGYLHLWKRLQQEPNLLEDKQLAWIGKGIAYPALHMLRHDWLYQKYTQAEEGYSSTDRRGTHSPESRQVDIRTDIHQAIATVADHILAHGKGKRATHDLWALYGLTMLRVSSSELSRMFQVREQSMQAAYNRIREQLKVALPHYAPLGKTKRVGKRGPEALPIQDIKAIRKANENLPDTIVDRVRAKIVAINADTRIQDEIALDSIAKGSSISVSVRLHNFPYYQMQRAFNRVHLMIAAEQDESVRTLRPEKRMRFVFTLTPESAIVVEAIALEFLQQPKSYEKLIALHAHISNLAISTTAKHFNIPTSTLRYYSQQIGKRLNTPTEPARHKLVGSIPQPMPEIAITNYSFESAAD